MTRHEVGAAHTPSPVTGATPALERLGIFVGTWITVGEIRGDDPDDRTTLRATDTYEWLPGGYFLLHHVDGTLGEHRVQALEIIGHDADRDEYFSQSYDNAGSTASYRASLDGRRWRIRGEGERFDGEFTEEGRELRGQWERLDDGRWVPWMTLSLTRAAEDAA